MCYNLNQYIANQKQPDDKYLSTDDYISCYVHYLCYNGTNFRLYAYEFKSDNDAKNYFCQVKGNTVDGNFDYRGNTNSFSSKLIVRNGENVYRFETGNTHDYVTVKKLLNSVFDVNIR